MTLVIITLIIIMLLQWLCVEFVILSILCVLIYWFHMRSPLVSTDYMTAARCVESPQNAWIIHLIKINVWREPGAQDKRVVISQ